MIYGDARVPRSRDTPARYLSGCGSQGALAKTREREGARQSRHRQARERPVAGPEMVGLDPQALEHAHVEIAQGRRVLRIEMQVLAVLEAAAGEEDGQIFRGVAAGVAEIAAEENGRAVEEVGVVLF